jgi:hypothetical protein
MAFNYYIFNKLNSKLAKLLIADSGKSTLSGSRLSRVEEGLNVSTIMFKSNITNEIRNCFSDGHFPAGVKVNLFNEYRSAFNQVELNVPYLYMSFQ